MFIIFHGFSVYGFCKLQLLLFVYITTRNVNNLENKHYTFLTTRRGERNTKKKILKILVYFF